MIDALTIFGIAALMFLLTNWIGKHSYQSGYFEIGQLSRSSGSTAFNYAYRIFAPIAILAILATLSTKLGLNFITPNLLPSLLAYFLLRVAYYFISDRVALVNKIEFVAIMIATVSLYCWIQRNLIENGEFLLPTKQEIGTAIWLAIAAFIYKTINSIEISETKARQRRKRYVDGQARKYLTRYGELINELSKDERERKILTAVMIYEGLNRPKAFQYIERLLLPFKRKVTVGPMQVSTASNISDEQSIRLGSQRLLSHYRELKQDTDRPEWSALSEALTSYNGTQSYAIEVGEVLDLLEVEA